MTLLFTISQEAKPVAWLFFLFFITVFLLLSKRP